MKKQGADYVVDSANDTFSFTILWRSVGARETKKDLVLDGEVLKSAIVEFASVVAQIGRAHV